MSSPFTYSQGPVFARCCLGRTRRWSLPPRTYKGMFRSVHPGQHNVKISRDGVAYRLSDQLYHPVHLALAGALPHHQCGRAGHDRGDGDVLESGAGHGDR